MLLLQKKKNQGRLVLSSSCTWRENGRLWREYPADGWVALWGQGVTIRLLLKAGSVWEEREAFHVRTHGETVAWLVLRTMSRSSAHRPLVSKLLAVPGLGTSQQRGTEEHRNLWAATRNFEIGGQLGGTGSCCELTVLQTGEPRLYHEDLHKNDFFFLT